MARKKEERIFIKGARTNNLKNIDVSIPKNKLVVVTGVSGSGKSSLVFDTLYAEGQRRYVESLSSYARQFLNRMKKPEVDFIQGICPAIAIEQRVSTANARSTVGSLTEIYDFIRMLFARVGKTISPISGQIVKKHSVSDVVDYIFGLKEDSKVVLRIPLNQQYADRKVKQELEILLQKGFSRVYIEDELLFIEDILGHNEAFLDQTIGALKEPQVFTLVDRLVVKKESLDLKKRAADSVLTAFAESGGSCQVILLDKKESVDFNNRFELDGQRFLEPDPHLFNYNNPFGACPRCEGFGRVMGIDENKVIPNTSLSVFENAVQPWKGEKGGNYLNRLLQNAHHFDFPVHRPYRDLSLLEKDVLWYGNDYFHGIQEYFDHLQEKSYKIQNRVLLARYRGRTICPECKGSRLRKEAMYVQVGKYTIRDLINLSLQELKNAFDTLELTHQEHSIADRLLVEIQTRLSNLVDLGLGYLHLDRVSSSLSGGETQRINLTKSLGSNLTNSMYILDEPSIGLHPKDTDRLVRILKKLRDLNNTVVVVEHEEEVIRQSDFLIDMGPEAGVHGGKVVFSGDFKKANGKANSLTVDYLRRDKKILQRDYITKWNNKISIKGARQHNLENLDIDIPLNALTVVSGVSGSGKSTLVYDILYQAMLRHLGEGSKSAVGTLEALEGDLNRITKVEMINQRPIGRSSRSNPVTYVKAYDAIRKLMCNQPLARMRGYKPKHFSFNVDGGRCDNCKGEGEIIVEMQFLADVRLMCDECKGKRFKPAVLEVTYNKKNIDDILRMTIEEGLAFFEGHNDILRKIRPLADVGLGYVQLGQSSSTLSGGEAQRVKLAFYLGKERTEEQILFIFDEPTTGLHFHDINKLLIAFDGLIDKGHSVLVVEHNLDIIRNADWVIDLGPEGGKNGGKLMYQGDVKGLMKSKQSVTAEYLRERIG